MAMDIERRLLQLERKNRRLTWLCLALFAGSLALSTGLALAGPKAGLPDVLHVRGLVVDDAQGRARIVMGAPFPDVPNRIRHDAGSVAMLFLDEQGHDRLTVGQSFTPQIEGKVPANFHRIGDSVGVIIHNTVGDERGGMSWLSSGRGAISFDYPDRDAIGMFVDDKNRSATFLLEYADAAIGDVSLFEMTAKGRGGRFTFFDPAGKPKTDWNIAEGTLSSLPAR
ncbi:hypothetical protein J2X57_002793 [Luteibacter sp. 1214]|uniref:hypothetical protein n=1 Tax=Luteibacter sp. 1214 TaxID=2817735 RepID=UPI00285A3568|nr:hypothetical protein [Luteibacter sp. 1214]MDR6643572.1 hypothetical protein [Luteibacter sp. 1214]